MRLDALVAFSLVTAACAAAGAVAPIADAQQSSRPEPDHACRTLVGAMLARRAIEQIVVTVAVEPDGGARVVRFAAPDLTATQRDDLQRAMACCAWTAATPPGGASTADVTFVRREPRQAR